MAPGADCPDYHSDYEVIKSVEERVLFFQLTAAAAKRYRFAQSQPIAIAVFKLVQTPISPKAISINNCCSIR